jgi:hypothetical protein
MRRVSFRTGEQFTVHYSNGGGGIVTARRDELGLLAW